MKKKLAKKPLSIIIDLCLSIQFTFPIRLEKLMFINIILDCQSNVWVIEIYTALEIISTKQMYLLAVVTWMGIFTITIIAFLT